MALLKIIAADPMKSDCGNDSVDTFIRQTMGKEPYLSFSMVNDSPVQLYQLLQAFEQQDISGVSFLSPMKIQMHKCDKCSCEFCSIITYRRHLRLHRRKLNLDKDSCTKIRGLLQAFWDKLSVEEAMEIMSFDDVSLEGVSGSSIIKALASFIRNSVYSSMPLSYVKSGSVLLDIVQGSPRRFPISSQELFNILDAASEKTFLCAGMAESLQKFVFNDDAGKIGLEMRNLVACTSFLVEQKLVKACLADKDVEALKYQKLLVEEEEAAQKRQAVLLEKKRQKKLRQKDQRAKALASGTNVDSPEESSPSPPSSTHDAEDNDSTQEMLEIPCDTSLSPEPSQVVNCEEDTNKDQENKYPDLGAHQNFEHITLHRGVRTQVINSHGQAPKSHRNPNGFHANHNYQKRASSKNSHTSANSTKVWTPKPKSESHEESSITRLLVDELKLPCQEIQLLIGSIPVPLGNHIIQGQDGNFGSGGQLSVHNSTVSSEVGGVLDNGSDLVHQTCVVERTSNGCEDECHSCLEAEHQGGPKFSRHVAEAFLSQRWKEAITADHIELVLFPEEPPGHSEAQHDNNEAVLSSKLDERSVLCSTENRLPVSTTIDSSTTMKPKARSKPKKGSKLKYIQKH